MTPAVSHSGLRTRVLSMDKRLRAARGHLANKGRLQYEPPGTSGGFT